MFNFDKTRRSVLLHQVFLSPQGAKKNRCKALITNNLRLHGDVGEGYISSMVQVELLGRALVVLREKQGMTQEELAAASKVTPSMISNYERGKERPSIESLWKVLEGLNATLIDLEAALRFVNNEPFPWHSANWKITIDAPAPTPGRKRGQPSEVAEPSVDLNAMAAQFPALPPEVQAWVMSLAVGAWQLKNPSSGDR